MAMKKPFDPAAFTGGSPADAEAQQDKPQKKRRVATMENNILPAAETATEPVKRSVGRPRRADDERRGKHFSFVMRQSAYDKLNQLARFDNVSVSDFLNRLIEDFVTSDESEAKLARFRAAIEG